MNGIIVHCDGASRGNPGPAAAGFVVLENGREVHRAGRLLGKATNNVAEYSAVIEALSWFVEKTPEDTLTFILDSQLIVNQLNGIYKIKDKTLQKLAHVAKSLEKDIPKKIIYRNVPRVQNHIADTLVNQILDGNWVPLNNGR